MNRDELNEIYRELESRMHRITAPFTSLHKGFDFSCGYYSGHYHKDEEGFISKKMKSRGNLWIKSI